MMHLDLDTDLHQSELLLFESKWIHEQLMEHKSLLNPHELYLSIEAIINLIVEGMKEPALIIALYLENLKSVTEETVWEVFDLSYQFCETFSERVKTQAYFNEVKTSYSITLKQESKITDLLNSCKTAPRLKSLFDFIKICKYASPDFDPVALKLPCHHSIDPALNTYARAFIEKFRFDVSVFSLILQKKPFDHSSLISEEEFKNLNETFFR